jgi:hypothetical protein
MPNWPLSSEVRKHLRERATQQAQRAVDLARSECPLTLEQIQYGASALTPDQIAQLKDLRNQGVKTISVHNEIRVAFLREIWPELRRGMVLRINLPEQIFVGHGTRYGVPGDKFTIDSDSYIVARFENLSAEERGTLTTWLDNLLRQQRIHEIVQGCVDYILGDYNTVGAAPTAAHLKAIWPMATTLIDPKGSCSHWVERFRNLPWRGVYKYAPSYKHTNYIKLLPVCDVQINTGLLLKKVAGDNEHDIYTTLEHWEHLSGDITFPLPDPK